MEYCVTNTNKLWELWEEKSPLEGIMWQNFDPELRGWSKASLRTNFILKKLKISLDAGLSCPYNNDHIFLTHGHCDHSANITFHLLQDRQTDDKKIDIYAPKEIIHILNNKIKSDFYLTESKKKKVKSLPYQIIGLEAGMKFQILINKEPSMVEVFKCYHSVPTLGYGISKICKRLKPEYENISNEEKKNLSKSGVKIKEEYEQPFMLYLGDTDVRVFGVEIPTDETISDLELNEEIETNDGIKEITIYEKLIEQDIFKYPIIMVECTFLLESDLTKARSKQHMHWNDLEPVIRSHPNNKFILYHFSRKYTNYNINKFFQECNKPENCYPWISP